MVAALVPGPPNRPIGVAVVVVVVVAVAVVVVPGDASGCVDDGPLLPVLPRLLEEVRKRRVARPGVVPPSSLEREEEEELGWANVPWPSGGLALVVWVSLGEGVVRWAWAS